MLDAFFGYFKVDFPMRDSGDPLRDFLTQLGGRQFGEGLFNAFTEADAEKWTHIVGEAYSDFAGQF